MLRIRRKAVRSSRDRSELGRVGISLFDLYDETVQARLAWSDPALTTIALKAIRGGSVQDRVEAGEMIEVGGVAAAQDAGHGDPLLEAGLEHIAFPVFQAGIAQRQPA